MSEGQKTTEAASNPSTLTHTEVESFFEKNSGTTNTSAEEPRSGRKVRIFFSTF
jgi:hypothetical protein